MTVRGAKKNPLRRGDEDDPSWTGTTYDKVSKEIDGLRCDAGDVDKIKNKVVEFRYDAFICTKCDGVKILPGIGLCLENYNELYFQMDLHTPYWHGLRCVMMKRQHGTCPLLTRHDTPDAASQLVITAMNRQVDLL